MLKIMRRFLSDVRKYIFYAIYSARVMLKSEVANSYLNWIWWVLEPILNMIVYTLVFKNVFGRSDPTYPVFIYSGVITWNYFSKNVNYSVRAMRSNKGIITKVYMPKYIIILRNMFLNLFKLFVGIAVMIPMLFLFHVPITWNAILLVPIYIGLFLFTFGCSMIVMHFGVFIDDLAYSISILLHVLMYLSGIFYNIDTALSGTIGWVVRTFNPVAFYIQSVRFVVLGTGEINFSILGIWYVISFILVVCGIRIIYKYENSYVKVI